MANLSHSESRRMYSWWWDSHISPKNSKWLQENLTDMDSKVKTMIKLIEEDADSFARRAEMYFKKRPELMKLVEEFYRAYRALAERYDHATGALRQAHRTMAEAFPNQVPFILADDLPTGSYATEVGPHTADELHPKHAILDPKDLHKGASGLSSSHFQGNKRSGMDSNDTDSVTSKTGLKQLYELLGSAEGVPYYVKFAQGRMRKGGNVDEESKNESKHEIPVGSKDHFNCMMKQGAQDGIFNQTLKTRIKSTSQQACKVETEVQKLKYSFDELEAEKEACLLQYQHALERLSILEAELSHSKEKSRSLNERASKAETEVRTLNEALIALQAEKEGGLLQYQQCSERMSDVEKEICNVQEDASSDEQRNNDGTDAQSLKQAFSRVKAEKEASLFQYRHCLEKISDLESKVSAAEDNVRNLNERAVRAETELQVLKETVAKLNDEKEAAALQYQRSLEIISNLQSEVSHAQNEATRLSSVMVMGLAKLSSMEEQYIQLERENQSLQTEIDTLVEMMEIQKQELSEKQEEIEGLQVFFEEEKFRSMETEDAFEALQNLHSECQEERGALVLGIQDDAQQFNEMELEYESSEEEKCHVKEESKILSKNNPASFVAEKSLPDEIFRLREAVVKLEKEVEVLVDQRNALQQVVDCLKEEMDHLRKQHVNVIEEMELVGLKPDCFGSSVRTLQEENFRLHEICQKDGDEKESLSLRLKDMDNILENNSVLENSLLDANIGLKSLRQKTKALEETCESLKQVYHTVVDEKESLAAHMETTNRNLQKLLQKNSFLETFLFDTDVERAWLREKSNSLEEFCQSLDSENCNLFNANNNLSVHLQIAHQELNDLRKSCTDLEENYLGLEKKLAAKIHEVGELQATLNSGKHEHACFVHTSESRLAHLERKNHILLDEVVSKTKDFEDEQEKDVNAQLEIFILLKCIRDMEDRKLLLISEYQKLLETSKSSENLITNLEREKFEQQVEFDSLLDQVEQLRFGIRQLALLLEISSSNGNGVEIEEDWILLQLAKGKIEDLKSSLLTTEGDKLQVLLEKSVILTVLGQLRLESASIESARSVLNRDLKLKTEDLLSLRHERDILQSASDHLNHQIGMGKVKLSQKEMQLSETEQKLNAIREENVELHGQLQDVTGEFTEARLAMEVLQKQIVGISQSNNFKNKEIEILHEAIQKLDLELNRLREDIKEQRVKEENLSYELKQKGMEIELLEHEAETLYCTNQDNGVHAALFEDKVHELVQACVSLEDERDSKTEDNEALRERIHALENEVRGVKSELASYHPVIVSMRGSVTSLEDRLIPHTKRHTADNQEIEVADFASYQHDNTNNKENRSLPVVDGFSELLDLQDRIEKIENIVIVEAAMKEVQKLENVGSESSFRKQHSTEPDFPEVVDEILVKDIPLDQVSHSSSYGRRFVPRAMSRREDSKRNEESVEELWETVEQDFDLDLTFHQKKLSAVLTQDTSGSHEIVSEEEKSENPPKEVRVGNKKILERLASDAQRLRNLQVTVEDLRRKIEQLDKIRKPNDAELNNLKDQLKEVDEGILHLLSTNGKLSKKAAVGMEEMGRERKTRTLERARRASEKIGRLHLEVQRIQLVLPRLEERYKIKGTKVGDRKVLLRDYLYGNLKSPHTSKRRKRLFFSCIKPPVA